MLKKKYTVQFKAKIASEAAKGDRSTDETASEYGIHSQQVRTWKREFPEKMHLVFEKESVSRELQKALDKASQDSWRLGGIFYRGC